MIAHANEPSCFNWFENGESQANILRRELVFHKRLRFSVNSQIKRLKEIGHICWHTDDFCQLMSIHKLYMLLLIMFINIFVNQISYGI